MSPITTHGVPCSLEQGAVKSSSPPTISLQLPLRHVFLDPPWLRTADCPTACKIGHKLSLTSRGSSLGR